MTKRLKKTADKGRVARIKGASNRDAPALLGYQPTYQSYLADRRARDRRKREASLAETSEIRPTATMERKRLSCNILTTVEEEVVVDEGQQERFGH